MPTFNEQPPACQIFCKVIDNYGDFGVCWRLARQLAVEYGADVIIWLDDFTVLTPWLSAGLPTQGSMFSGKPDGEVDSQQGTVRVLPWEEAVPQNSLGQPVTLLIEAFACELPASYIEQIAKQPLPLWVNLEYLSAEEWVGGCHGLSSIQPGGLQKLFFFPGFVAGTGGLLREQEIVARHARWQADESGHRGQMLRGLGVHPDDIAVLRGPGALLISAFTYETPAFKYWLQALERNEAPVLLLLPPGPLQAAATAGSGAAVTGNRIRMGELSVALIPFQTQDDYDRMLSLCDINLVRGEDSFVRAQWAARPMLWHIYPQKDDAHVNKLGAFLDLYSRAGSMPLSASQSGALHGMRAFWTDWNEGRDCGPGWASFCAHLPALRDHALLWREKLLELDDLASNLMNFYKNTL